MGRKKRKKSRQKGSQPSYVQDGRATKIIGMLAISLSVFMFFSFLSYFFTWKDDFNQVRMDWLTYLFDPVYQAENFLGKFGALLAHIFMFRGVGIMAFALVYLLFKTGMLLLLANSWKKLWVEWRWGAFLIIYLSVFFSFAFSGIDFNIGGNLGLGIKNSLVSLIGGVGLTLLFIFSLLFLVVWLFNPDFNELSFRDKLRIQWSDLVSGFSSKKTKKKSSTTTSKREEKPAEENTSQEETVSAEPSMAFDQPKNNQENDNKDASDTDGFKIVVPEEDEESKLEQSRLKTEEFKNLQASSEKLSVEQENVSHLEPYDPTKDLSHYEHPPIDLLNVYSNDGIEFDREELNEKKDQIVQTLQNYKIEIKKIWATIGPTVTLYEIVPAPGVKISKIKNLEDDIALSLAALGIRIIAPIPGKGTVGIEVPNKKRQIVGLRSIIKSRKFQEAKMDLPIALGKTIANEVFIADLAKMPHLLVAGATGQGKSVGINAILASILYKKHPSQVKLVLIDPKKVELSIYTEIENH
ncbi:MAG TPA: DNA translocase FtsK 4TM domain-containing protein, partial [Saprospiraceae bacterium]|nr:DNA translocase FtsK 4TM domain-containing protein [Saprospiraceae bacterium]